MLIPRSTAIYHLLSLRANGDPTRHYSCILFELLNLKQGKASCQGRASIRARRQDQDYQIGVFATYASRHDYAFINRALYLRKGWTDSPNRLKAVHAPEHVGLQLSPSARRMVARMLAAQVS
ncbi:MAG: hypothetical protein JO189_25480 [Deltaproteobacteria bacterium]|nr:hypothetical protein [Deltaproteobacteria bacterium]